MLKRNTFHLDKKVSSVYLHDTRDGQQQVVKEESGLVLGGCHRKSFFYVVAYQRTSLPRKAVSGKNYSLQSALCDA